LKPTLHGHAPARGEHTREVATELGMSAGDMADLLS
jgi:hypothetical protein